MAKKSVAKFSADKASNKKSVKCIRMVRSDRSGSYLFQEEMIPTDEVKEFFNK
ncbi:MAG: DUF4295 domain-containing protein [Bacteroidales bacterium]|nr:DUF4295 domain-containing protein [Bacteroidales bacterium]MDD4656094.1 DUF4295 domain-containing protein [Bacteroidales bacterium]